MPETFHRVVSSLLLDASASFLCERVQMATRTASRTLLCPTTADGHIRYSTKHQDRYRRSAFPIKWWLGFSLRLLKSAHSGAHLCRLSLGTFCSSKLPPQAGVPPSLLRKDRPPSPSLENALLVLVESLDLLQARPRSWAGKHSETYCGRSGHAKDTRGAGQRGHRNVTTVASQPGSRLRKQVGTGSLLTSQAWGYHPRNRMSSSKCFLTAPYRLAPLEIPPASLWH